MFLFNKINLKKDFTKTSIKKYIKNIENFEKKHCVDMQNTK